MIPRLACLGRSAVLLAVLAAPAPARDDWVGRLGDLLARRVPAPAPADPSRPGGPVTELQLVAAWPIERGALEDEPRDFSGLAWVNGRLLTVSDKIDDRVYEIVPPAGGSGVARLREALRFELPPFRRVRGGLDWEGLTLDDEGNLHLVSEAYSRILRITPDGSVTGWLETPDLEATARSVGLLAQRNAGFEGIAWIPGGRIYLAAEREPRGLVFVDLGRRIPFAVAARLDDTRYPPAAPRRPDFADLFWDRRDGVLFALQRNAEVITPLWAGEGAAATEGHAWSFRETARRPEFRYAGDVFGLAEGLAMTADRVYVLYDTNDVPRLSDPSDRRPLLFVFERPSTPAR